ncbi:MAG: tetratricopeptide repeat protein [Bacteroidales bacterium]|nr:tetratricopeptide repeat protein [Bacteroidales bacterium]MBR2475589.1 tetratricopeptide repeat protein [Bacteroidaceae bacterium]MBR3609633.1 tetratricopeptide repeat protein [Bacteroidales bacterium]
MAKEQQMDELDKMNNVLSTGEQWIEKNGKKLTTIVIIAILVVAGFLMLKQFYFAPMEEEAQNAMYKGEIYFEQDNFEVALNGNEADFIGFKAIADEYSGTKAGNLANAYAGICAYNLGNNEEALEYFEAYDGGEALLYPNIIAMIGNCYANMGDYDKAISNFVKAADEASNSVISPLFLVKAATVAEKLGDNAQALEFYQEIKDKYENSVIGQDIDKYIERTEAQVK